MKGDKFEGARCVCSPPPRESPLDQAAIWRGILLGMLG
jgi:dihydropyrimidinase